MVEIHINKDDIKSIVESYITKNSTFVIRSFIDGEKQKECKFYINGKECRIVFYIKKNSVRIMPIGKNVDESNLLIEYVKTKGFSTDAPVKQFTFECKEETVNSLLEYIKNECKGIIEYNQSGNIIKFTGYNSDVLTFTFYPQTNKAMIQGKPFQVFGIILSFLAELSEFTFEKMVDMGNAFTGINTSSTSIRNDMKTKLGNAYYYLDEALLKSISGSFSLLKQKESSEDYTGCVTGVFKALEGYLKKLLSQKFNYKIQKQNAFSMFYKNNGTPSEIEGNQNIPTEAKEELIKLNKLYSNKRNVYLHSTIDPSQTRIIETIKEAQYLVDDILRTIKESYEIIF